MRIMEMTKDEYLALDRDTVVPVVPLGSVEQHGPHLPMGTDSYQVEAIAQRMERRLEDVALLNPVLWIGNSVNHLGYGACIYVEPVRYAQLLTDIGRCFLDSGFRHLFFLNGHGANVGPLTTALHQLEHDYIRLRDDLQIAAASWWALAESSIEKVRESPEGAAGHACEIETSVMLSARPSLVRTDRFVEGPAHHPHPEWASYDFNGRNPVTFVEMFHRDAPDGVVGRPDLGSPAKGETIVDECVERLAEFLQAFSEW